MENKNTDQQEQPGIIELMFDVLSSIGCQPRKNDNNTISVSYQGEDFYMEFGDVTCPYCRVWDLGWSRVEADSPYLFQVKEAVNAANFNFGPTVVLTGPDEEEFLLFHSRWDIIFHPAYPEKEDYVRAVLNTFFTAKVAMRAKFDEFVNAQSDNHKNRRPIGFATTQTEKQTEEQ